MKATRHIEYTPRESRLMQEAIAHYVNFMKDEGMAAHEVYRKEVEDLRKLKERIRLGPVGALQEAREFLRHFRSPCSATRRSMEYLSALKLRVERIERRHRNGQAEARAAAVLLNQLSPPHP